MARQEIKMKKERKKRNFTITQLPPNVFPFIFFSILNWILFFMIFVREMIAFVVVGGGDGGADLYADGEWKLNVIVVQTTEIPWLKPIHHVSIVGLFYLFWTNRATNERKERCRHIMIVDWRKIAFFSVE